MSPTVREDCPCPRVTCKRHTLCDECEESNGLKGEIPFCRRPKRSLWEKICRLLRSGK